MPSERSQQATGTMIPVPRSTRRSVTNGAQPLHQGNLTSVSRTAADSKLAKTEKNRLQLMMRRDHQPSDDDLDYLGVDDDDDEDEDGGLMQIDDKQLEEDCRKLMLRIDDEDVSRKQRSIGMGEERDDAGRRNKRNVITGGSTVVDVTGSCAAVVGSRKSKKKSGLPKLKSHKDKSSNGQGGDQQSSSGCYTGSSSSLLGTFEPRRRPVSLYGARDDVLRVGGATWRPVSALLQPSSFQQTAISSKPSAHQANSTVPNSSSSSHRQEPSGFSEEIQTAPPKTEITFRKQERVKQEIDAVVELEQRGNSETEPCSKNGQSCELGDISVEDDSCPVTPLQAQGLPKSSITRPMKQDLWELTQSTGSPAAPITPASHNDLGCAMSFSSGTPLDPPAGMQGQRRLGAKMDVVYSLLSMLGNSEGRDDMSGTLLSMSNSVESCVVMRQSGCLPLLIQLIHAPGQDPEIRERASRALYNIVHAKNDEKSSRREVRVLRLLEQLRDYCQSLRSSLITKQISDDLDRHPSATIAALMKLSFDEAHRHAMCLLGGLHAVAELIEVDHAAHGCEIENSNCITLRRYSGMALTNLTFGDGNNKALLCSFQEFMKALVSQLRSSSDDLRQVTASVLRNLSWRADSSSKQTLREVGAVIGLMKAAMEGRKESTLKSILSALWNLSAHCSTNKIDICAVEGALAFLVDMLNYDAPSKTLAIVENAGGILRNVSSHVAVRDDYREVVRKRGCLQVLLRQLRSPSLTVVSNACGTLWNLSARCPQDQRLLWDLGAVPMLRSLVHSKHKMISMGSSAALKNLLSARPTGSSLVHLDSTARGLGLPTLPSLMARRQKALEQEIDQNLAETCDNIEPSTSPVTKEDGFSFKLDQNFVDASGRDGKGFYQTQAHSATNQTGTSGLKHGFPRSESRESMRSVTSTQSDTIFEKVNRSARNGIPPSELQLNQQSTSLHSSVHFDTSGSANGQSKASAEKKYTLRYMNAIPERLKPGEPLPDLRGLNCTNSTISWAASPSQEVGYSKGLLHSSVEDNLSLTNSCDSSNSKAGLNFDSSSCKQLGAKPRNITSGDATLNFSLKNVQSATTVRESTQNLVGANKHQPKDYSLKYSEHTSDDDKQSSAYFTSTDHEQDTVKTSCTEETPNQSSLDSSRASSAADLHEENRLRPHLRRITSSTSCNGLKYMGANTAGFRHSIHGYHNGLDSKADSLQSHSSESTSTVEAGESLGTDSAIFDENHKSGESSGVPSLGSLVRDEPKLTKKSEKPKVNSLQYIDPHPENNLVKYKTNAHLNDIKIQDIDDDIILKTRPKSLSTAEPKEQQESHDDEDVSEATQTNDYYTVQETYTLEKNPQKGDQLLSPDDDCTITQTLSFMSVDDRDSQFNYPKSGLESTENLTETMHTAVASNSESCESFDSVERSEHALLELCIKSGVSKPDSLSSLRSSGTSKSSFEANFRLGPISDRSNIPSRMGGSNNHDDRYRKQRDPDAMIASLDRLTATLVQQSEAMRERDSSTMKGSLLSDTWNEDSPNDVSFPSISVSAPFVASFKSEDTEISEEYRNNPSSMTDSKIIEREAIKLAEAVSAETNQISLTSLDLDAINPPSAMGSLVSLTASIGGVADNADNSDKSRCQSTSLQSANLFARKKSLPIGVVARRALNYGQNRTGSLENLLNECNSGNHSQLENVKPPSIMDELVDVGDMENSMLSVASITSEIVDSKDNSLTCSDPVFDLIKPVANVLSMTCMRYAETMQASGQNSLSECLDNINPPSLFNEVSQMDDSTVDANTHCSETLCGDTDQAMKGASHFVFDERIEELANDTDEGATPLSSEYGSSVESTPKKRLFKNRPGHLTPKQKRQLVKERYKTYTIAAERAKKEQEDLKKQEQMKDSSAQSQIGKCSPFSKLTPKQRRQEDRARFQTRVLESPVLEKAGSNDTSETESLKTPSMEKSPVQTAARTGIPMPKKFGSGSKTFKINRSTDQESKEKIRDDPVPQVHTPERNATTVSPLHPLPREKSRISTTDDSETTPSAPKAFENGPSKKSPHQSPQQLSPTRAECTKIDDSDKSQSESEDSSSEKDDEARRAKFQGPRIVKPGGIRRDPSVESDRSEPEAPKGIRGRRKPLYSKAGVRNSTPQCSPMRQPATTQLSATPISRSNSSPVVRATRTMQLRQHNSVQKINGVSSDGKQRPASSGQQAKRSAIPQKGGSARQSSTESAAQKVELPYKLERQGTFTKDEPETENAPTVLPMSPCKGKIAKPSYSANKGSPKTSPLHGKSKISVRTPQKLGSSKLTKTTSVEKISTPTSIPSPAKRSSTNLTGTVVKSSSNYQISSPNESGIPRRFSLGPRSNSNSSIVSNSSNQGARSKMVKEATSKIASLWKKVEENKNKQRFEKTDTRQWITTNKEPTRIASPCGSKQQPHNLYRSSTFEGITNDSTF